MPYQNSDDAVGHEAPTVHESHFNLNWKTITIAAIVVICLFFVADQRNGSTTGSLDLQAADSSIHYSEMGETDINSLFKSFKKKFHKSYGSAEEESEKYSNFKAFLQLIDERNDAEQMNGGSAVHGITQFADISQTDFENTYLGYKPVSTRRALKGEKPTVEYITDTTSGIVTWVDVYTTSVNNQV